jgi:hypothetical protein
VEISFQLKTPQLIKKWLEFISQHKKNNAFAIFNQFIVFALTHCVSTTLIGYRSQLPAAASDPQCSAKLNLLCENGLKRKSWEKT